MYRSSVGDHKKTVSEQWEVLNDPSKGRRFAGLVIILFGSLTMLVVAFAYAGTLLTFATFIFDIEPDRKIQGAYFGGFLIGSMAIHIIGQIMIMVGDYMRGKMSGMSEKDILWRGWFQIMRDMHFIIVGFSVVGVLCGFASGQAVICSVSFVVGVSSFCLVRFAKFKITHWRKENG